MDVEALIEEDTVVPGMRPCSAEDLRKAAEALVEAAICCHSLHSTTPVSEQVRARLVQAVLDDPSITPSLFSPHAFRLI